MRNCIILVLTFFPLLAVTSCIEQTNSQGIYTGIPNTTYKNVLEITDHNLVTDGHNFLFNRAIPRETNSPVVFVSAKVPSDVLPYIYPEFKRITIITPNWKLYEEREETSIGEPIASSIVYQMDRENEMAKIDTTVIMGGFPKMELMAEDRKGNNILKVYFTEGYSSICCPRDPKWDLKPGLKAYVTAFEAENKVKIDAPYEERRGKEGEVNYYYSLNGISDQLKLKFIADRRAQISNAIQMKNITNVSGIFTPSDILINDSIKIRR